MRATMSPAFTSLKMRNIFNFVEEIGRNMTEFLMDDMKRTENRSEIILSGSFILNEYYVDRARILGDRNERRLHEIH
jgi:L-cysteine desulfidase